MDAKDEGRSISGEALDHHHLPQRPVGRQAPAHEVPDQAAELGAARGSGKAHPADVRVDVEVRILDPHGAVQGERRGHHPTPEGRRQVQP